MKTPVGSLIVIDSFYVHAAVTPFVFKVVNETEKWLNLFAWMKPVKL